MGPWETEEKEPKAEVHYRILQFIGRLVGEPVKGRQEIETVWGNADAVSDKVVEVAEDCVLALEEEQGQLFAQVLAYNDEEKQAFKDLPEGTRVVVYAAGLEFHGKDSRLYPPSERSEWRWSSNEVDRRSHWDFALPTDVNLYPLGARVEVWRDELFIGYARHDWTSVGQYFTFDLPAFQGARIKGGEVVSSILWDPDKPVTVALHGSFDYQEAPASRAELEAGLRKLGCVVHEKVGPGTDLVVLGSNLLQDAHYRKARSDLRFNTIRDDDVVNYFK